VDIVALHEALDRLAAQDPRKAELVKLRFFAGLSNEQAAAVLGISPRTAFSDWGYARAWLRVEMADQAATGG
jgi:DNA-directed RNA polymerase specialized sigma24 family protein